MTFSDWLEAYRYRLFRMSDTELDVEWDYVIQSCEVSKLEDKLDLINDEMNDRGIIHEPLNYRRFRTL
jgi:hypothetical protein